MKTSKITAVLVLVSCAIVVSIGSKWLGRREARASSQMPVEELVQGEQPRMAFPQFPADREELPILSTVNQPLAVISAAKPTVSYTFLPSELTPLSTMIPERLKAFDAATPVERLQLGRELLVHSIAVIMCATGSGPIGKGMLGDGDLSFAGRDGKWAFQVNTSTFHFYDYEYPEYPEYMALLRSSYDEQMVPLATTTELPEDLAERIRRRAYEALGWL